MMVDIGASLMSSMVFPDLIFSNMLLSEMLPTGVSPLRTGSCENPAVLMSSDATRTLSVL